MTRDSRTAPLRVALVQFKPRKGAVEANLARVRETLDREKGLSDVVVFRVGGGNVVGGSDVVVSQVLHAALGRVEVSQPAGLVHEC